MPPATSNWSWPALKPCCLSAWPFPSGRKPWTNSRRERIHRRLCHGPAIRLERPLRRPGRNIWPAGHEVYVRNGNVFGVDPSDPDGKDDIQTLNEIHVPVNKPVIIYLSSKDVIHSFKIIAMRVCQDAIPGLRIPFGSRPREIGVYQINCAQLCGPGHAAMTGGFLTVESQADFDKWLAVQKSRAGHHRRREKMPLNNECVARSQTSHDRTSPTIPANALDRNGSVSSAFSPWPACFCSSELKHQPPLPVIGQVADFTLTNQDGQITTLASLTNRVWVADIIFTRCASSCPIMTQQMKSLQDALPPDSEAKLVTLTCDPDYDSPAILKRYGEHYGADFQRWMFLTGTPKRNCRSGHRQPEARRHSRRARRPDNAHRFLHPYHHFRGRGQTGAVCAAFFKPTARMLTGRNSQTADSRRRETSGRRRNEHPRSARRQRLAQRLERGFFSRWDSSSSGAKTRSRTATA